MSNNPVNELTKILRETFGAKTKGMIARAPMWGHEDNCWIFYGEMAKKAAELFAARMKAKITESVSGLGTTFIIEWK